MSTATREWYRNDFGPAEANQRIESWYRRGYVMFSDRYTRSTHLRTVQEWEAGRTDAPASPSPFRDERSSGAELCAAAAAERRAPPAARVAA